MKQLMTMMANLASNQTQVSPNPPIDPQFAELEAGTFSIPHFPYMEPDHSPQKEDENLQNVRTTHEMGKPPAGTLKDYHDITEDIINRKMRQITAKRGPKLVEPEVQKPYDSWHD